MNTLRAAAAIPDAVSLCRLIAARNLPLASLAALGLAFALPAQAATISVTAGAVDDAVNGNCSLVEAVRSANNNVAVDACVAGDNGSGGGDIVQLPAAGNFAIPQLAPGMYWALGVITSKVTIAGNGSTVSSPSELINVTDGAPFGLGVTANLTLSGLHLTGAESAHAIAVIAVNNATLNLVDSEVSGNNAFLGAISANSGYNIINITRSTIAGNTGSYGIVYSGFGYTSVVNSTISGNSGSDAIWCDSCGIAVASSTVSGNSGAGLRSHFATIDIKNSIVSDNSGGNCVVDIGDETSIIAGGGNLSSDATCAGFSLSNADPLLGALADNGGPVRTHALLAGSPAIDAASGAGIPVTDQRGVARPQGAASDLGAYEVEVMSDTTPEAFNFPNVSDAPVSTLTLSKVLTLTGFDTPAAISVSAGEYSFNGTSWTSAAGSISPGQTLQLRLGSSMRLSTAKSMTVTVGGVSDTFGVKTTPYDGDVSPDDFHIYNSPNVAPNTPVTSRAIIPVGYDSPAPVTVTAGCFYIIDNGAPGNGTGTIMPGQTLRLSKQSPAANGTKFQCDVTIGYTKVRWIGKTVP